MMQREDTEGLRYWLSLSMVRGVAQSVREAIEEGKDVREIFHSVTSGRRDTGGILDTACKEMEKAHAMGVELIGFDSPLYPEPLRHIHEPPLVLYAMGRLELLSSSSVAVVGTRNASSYGRCMAERLGAGLSEAGISVVSGMARGCDTFAHRGALAKGGNTIAVLGTGIDIVYPKENRRLYDEIKEQGLVVTEFPFSTPPLAKNFPVRNRIISGLTSGVVVVEAPLKSGAMMTARLSLEAGREVFALPGRADSKRSGGTNRLIKEGAVLVEDTDDILSVLFPEHCAVRTEKTENPVEIEIDGEEELIFRVLDDEPLHIDNIVEKSGLPVERLTSVLLTMELKGFVEQRPGKFFVKRTD